MNETIKIWIELSQSDLNSSRLLYNNNHCRASYFLFQQATEKANKAYALLAGLLSDEELKSIQHDQIKIYRKIIVKQGEEIKSLNKTLKTHPKIVKHEITKMINSIEYHKLSTNGLRVIDDLRNTDLVNISIANLNSIIQELKKLKEVKLQLPNDTKQALKMRFLAGANWVEDFESQVAVTTKNDLINLLNNTEQFEQLHDLMVNRILPMTKNIIFVHWTLFFCALITVQHSSLARYPDNGINPETIYNKDLPIVKKQAMFMDLLENSLFILNKLNET